MKIREMITDRYKLRIPPTVYYELLADVQELEEKEDPTTKNDLGVDAVSRQAVLDLIANYDLSMGQVVKGIHALPSITPQEPKTGHWIPTYGNVKCSVCGSVKDSREVGKATHYCDFCGARMFEPQKSEG